MKLTIDTKTDSKEELIHVIDLLNKITRTQNQSTILPAQQSEPEPISNVNALVGLFNDNPKPTDSTPEAQPEPSTSALAGLFDDEPKTNVIQPTEPQEPQTNDFSTLANLSSTDAQEQEKQEPTPRVVPYMK